MVSGSYRSVTFRLALGVKPVDPVNRPRAGRSLLDVTFKPFDVGYVLRPADDASVPDQVFDGQDRHCLIGRARREWP